MSGSVLSIFHRSSDEKMEWPISAFCASVFYIQDSILSREPLGMYQSKVAGLLYPAGNQILWAARSEFKSTLETNNIFVTVNFQESKLLTKGTYTRIPSETTFVFWDSTSPVIYQFIWFLMAAGWVAFLLSSCTDSHCVSASPWNIDTSSTY